MRSAPTIRAGKRPWSLPQVSHRSKLIFAILVVGMIVLGVAIGLVIFISSWSSGSRASVVTAAPVELSGPMTALPKKTLPAASDPVVQKSEPVSVQDPVVAPQAPIVELQWVEIGRARNGEEVLALPIPRDRVVTDLGAAVTPTDEVISTAILNGRFSLPPATSIARLNPVSKIRLYLLEGDKVTLYGYSDYHWSEQDPQALTYWKAEVPLATIKGLSP